MLGNMRNNRLFAFSSSVCLQVNLPGQTLRALWIQPLSALERLENRGVACAFPPTQRPHPQRRMDAVYEFMT